MVRYTSPKISAVHLIKPLKKEHAKIHSGMIGFFRKKKAICRRNVIKHEKAKYKKFLSEPCLLNDGDKCTLHHQFFENVDGKV